VAIAIALYTQWSVGGRERRAEAKKAQGAAIAISVVFLDFVAEVAAQGCSTLSIACP